MTIWIDSFCMAPCLPHSTHRIKQHWDAWRILELSQQAAAGDITAGHTVAALAPIVHARLHPEEQPAAPDL
jgi:hypothetical protein